jgi:hypothetical protein
VWAQGYGDGHPLKAGADLIVQKDLLFAGMDGDVCHFVSFPAQVWIT